jgi:tetratricopeptide (TPR) repeat protein
MRKQCVTEQSATYGKENFGLSVDHSGLNKYTSRDDENYKRILGKLLDIIKPITSQKQHQLYSVPITTVESYVKRAALSSKLEDELRVKSHEGGGPRVLPVHGLGGTGKSQLVRQYIEDHKNEYSPILWIDETDEESVRSSFERCAGELGLPMDLRGTQTSKLIDFSAVQAVLRWFRNRRGTDERWLVVIDNVDNHALGIRTIFPEGRNGSIVITSQDKKLLSRMKDYKEVEVGVMDPLEAKTLLVGHLKLEVNTAPDDVLVDCDKIAKKLGHLPLAVDLAGAYIGNDVDPIRSLRQYLADYEKQQDFLLESTSFCDSSASDKTVWTVWSTTIKRIEERHASLRPGLLLAFLARFRGDVVLDELLRLASLGLSTAAEGLYGDTARLPEWLANILKTDGKDWIDFYYRQGCDVLVRYSLLQRTTGPFQGVKMHGLVEWRAKKYEEEQPWEEWYLVAMLAGCVQSAKSAASPAVRRGLFTNTFGVDEKYLDRVGVKDDRKAFVWGTIDVMQLHAHQYVETEELFIRVMEISSRVLGKAHIYTLGIKVNLALMYRNQGRWSKAKELEAQVRETSKQELTREQRLELVNLVAGLALSNIERRWWEAAEGLSLKVRQICSRVLGEEHLDTVTIAASLALTYRHQGRLKESEELDLHVIGIRKRVLGEGHIDTLTSMFSLALTYYSQTRQGEAVELLMQALEIANRLLGEGHLATFQPDSTCYAGLLEAE